MITKRFYMAKLAELHDKVFMGDDLAKAEDVLRLIKLIYWKEHETLKREEEFENYWRLE